MLVALLIFIAYALYADRKIWAAVQLRRGPNVVGPWGLLQSFADLLKFVLKEPVIPAQRQQGHVPARAARDLRPWRWRPGRSSRSTRAGPSPTSMSASSTSSRSRRSASTASSWAAGPRTRSTRSSARCARRPRWCPTRSRSASSSSPCCMCAGSLNLTRHRRIAEHPPRHPRLVLAAAVPDVRHLLHLGAWPRRTARPSTCRRRNPSSSPATWSSTRRRRTCCSCSASTWPS